MKIGIELNNVIRDVNSQIVKYYIKEFDPSTDIEDIDCKQNVLETYTKFKSTKEKNDFIYIDYPYEIFGCAKTMEKGLAAHLTNWINHLSDYEDEEIEVVLYSLYEAELTIQSTFFFLSKIGARVRTVLMPKDKKEVLDACDVIVTANKEFLEDEIPQGKKVVLINRPFNEDVKEKATLNYDNLSDLLKDDELFEKLKK